MTKVLVLFLLFAFTVVPVAAQNEISFQADRFNELVLDQATLEKAVAVLGQPDSDKVDRLDTSEIGKWLIAKQKEKEFRQLSFKKINGFHLVKLSFLNNELVMIHLEPKKNIPPPKLTELFGVTIVPLWSVGRGFGLSDTPGQYPQPSIVVNYPSSYGAIGITGQSFIYATCSSTNPDSMGQVDKIRIVSRVLERK